MISVIGTVGVPACYGGFESLVENLIPSKKIGLIYCSKQAYNEQQDYYKNTKLKFIPLNANGVQSIPYDIISILHSLFFTKNDLLILGVSGAIALPIFKVFTRRKVVTNIDGLEWKRAKWGRFAKWFLRFSEKVAVKFSDTVIADNAAIAEHVKASYGVDAEVIAYGGDHAVTDIIPTEKKSYSLALCRIEPENNVEMILSAFSLIPNEQIKFIGNWNNSEFGKQLKVRFKDFSNIELIDPIYDLNQLFEIRKNAKVYVHGHSAGGTNPSLVEMMFFRIPIYCFDCNYNKASTEDKAKYFYSDKNLVELINENNEVENNQIGSQMKEVAERRYTWKIVKQQYEDLF